jgi:hypothetical protein
MEGGMRSTFLSIVLASVIAGGCNGAEPAPGNALAAPAHDDAARPVSTAGSADATRAPDVVSAGAAWREVTIPAGTLLPLTLDTSVGSDTSRVEEPVTAHLARPIRVHGVPVLLEGTRVTGVVTAATRSAKVKGRAHIALRFDSMTPRGDDQRYAIRTAAVGRTAAATKEKDALEIGAPAAGGAIIGALVGGKKGALVGTAVGGGAGTAVVLSTRGKEVRFAKGAALTLTLRRAVTVRVRQRE